MNPLKAAHLLDVAEAGLSFPSLVAALAVLDSELPTNCAMFLPNLSLSIASSFSLLFVAPGLLFILFCLILPLSPLLILSKPSPSKSGRASARLSNVVTNFLFGRLRLRGLL
ncbi:hypothetical protein ACMFMG_006895 [Clarireedia jacksonii]